MNNNYSKILYLNHYEPSEKHKRMSIYNRSAQFSSFKALEGYENEINKKNEILEKKIVLDNDEKELLNIEINKVKKGNKIYIKYYDNGKYLEKNCICIKIDKIYKYLIIENNIKIKIEDITNIKLL